MKKKKVKTKPVIELKRIGDLNARLIEEDGRTFVELYVRMQSTPLPTFGMTDYLSANGLPFQMKTQVQALKSHNDQLRQYLKGFSKKKVKKKTKKVRRKKAKTKRK